MSLSREQEPTLEDQSTYRQKVTTGLVAEDYFREAMLSRARMLRIFRDIDPDMGRDAAVNGEPLQGSKEVKL